MQNPRVLVFAKTGQALRFERALDAAGAIDSVQCADGMGEVAVMHQRHDDLGVFAPAGHGDVEVPDPRANVGNNGGDLRAAIRLCFVVDIDSGRPVVFADAVDAAGDMEFSAEGDLEQPVDDLGV